MSLPVRALVLLLAFGLGGLAAPVAHAWSHVGEAHAVTVCAETPSIQAPEGHAAHDCSLCEVRLLASVGEAPPLVTGVVPEGVLAPGTQALPHRVPLPCRGRAPPERG